MKIVDIKKEGYKGEYYASIQFAILDGGMGEYKHMTTDEVRWEVVTKNPNGSFNVRDMNGNEYDAYKNK